MEIKPRFDKPTNKTPYMTDKARFPKSDGDKYLVKKGKLIRGIKFLKRKGIVYQTKFLKEECIWIPVKKT